MFSEKAFFFSHHGPLENGLLVILGCIAQHLLRAHSARGKQQAVGLIPFPILDNMQIICDFSYYLILRQL